MRGLLSVVLAVLLSACGFKYHDSISGNGKVETRILTTDTINKLVLPDKLNVVLIPSDTSCIALRIDENLMPVFTVARENNNIELYCNKLVRMARAREVLVYGNCVRNISLAHKSELRSEGKVNAVVLTIQTGTGTNINLEGTFDTLNLEIGAGNDAYLSGESNYVDINASGGSDVYAFSLMAKEAFIRADGASDVRISISDKAYLYAANFADIRYRGSPQIIESRSSGLADIKKAR